ncbi:MAG TPA: ABC transporter ATP-binding protein [Armatimonadetes bacterium]|jgi:subfamily B ATP-binding cassette protein MsbA|nr:ABC transporter ATP-binding protein [Armatimonadota bacterium]
MSLLFRILVFTRRYRWVLAWALFLVFVGTALNMLIPHLVGLLVDKIAGFEKLSDLGNMPPATLGEYQDDAWRFLLVVCGVMMGSAALAIVMLYPQQMALVFVGNRVVYDIRRRLFRHLQRLSMRYFETNPHGRIMSRVLYDVEAVQGLVSSQLISIITNIITLIVASSLLFVYSPRLAVLAVGVLPLYVINFLMVRQRIHHSAAEAREQYSQIYTSLSESISGIKVVKSFTRENSEVRGFAREVRESIAMNMRLGHWQVLLTIGSELITRLANMGILLYGGYLVLYTGEISMGQLIAFRNYQAQLYTPVLMLVTINNQLQNVLTAVERIFETLDTSPDIAEKKEPVHLERIEGRVEMEKVDFSYEPGDLVLDDISFIAEPGTVNALVGPSGSGKTTLVHLIPRFYDPVDGSVKIDGHDLQDVSINSLRRQIGMVMQEDFLFSGTLRENIKYGRPQASDEEVVRAAMAANAHDFIMEFPDGYESMVGERGTRLSGGQRQRISIARALLRDPRILILDEATSALDSESESLIQEALEHLMQNRTTFTIAHRLSTVMNADVILVLDHGRVVERGKHAELATAGGVYQMLCEVQFNQAVEKMREHEAELARQKAAEAAAAGEATAEKDGHESKSDAPAGDDAKKDGDRPKKE